MHRPHIPGLFLLEQLPSLQFECRSQLDKPVNDDGHVTVTNAPVLQERLQDGRRLVLGVLGEGWRFASTVLDKVDEEKDGWGVVDLEEVDDLRAHLGDPVGMPAGELSQLGDVRAEFMDAAAGLGQGGKQGSEAEVPAQDVVADLKETPVGSALEDRHRPGVISVEDDSVEEGLEGLGAAEVHGVQEEPPQAVIRDELAVSQDLGNPVGVVLGLEHSPYVEKIVPGESPWKIVTTATRMRSSSDQRSSTSEEDKEKLGVVHFGCWPWPKSHVHKSFSQKIFLRNLNQLMFRLFNVDGDGRAQCMQGLDTVRIFLAKSFPLLLLDRGSQADKPRDDVGHTCIIKDTILQD